MLSLNTIHNLKSILWCQCWNKFDCIKIHYSNRTRAILIIVCCGRIVLRIAENSANDRFFQFFSLSLVILHFDTPNLLLALWILKRNFSKIVRVQSKNDVTLFGINEKLIKIHRQQRRQEKCVVHIIEKILFGILNWQRQRFAGQHAHTTYIWLHYMTYKRVWISLQNQVSILFL